jgi:hypothetical protein
VSDAVAAFDHGEIPVPAMPTEPDPGPGPVAGSN